MGNDIDGKVFGDIPEEYDRFRPEYCSGLTEAIFACSGIGEGSVILEIGIGTGKATVPFLEAGCNVDAVDISENMIEFCREKFAGYKNLFLVTADFAVFDTPLRYDLIYSATAFHWIPSEISYMKALSLLRPGGTLAVFRNYPAAGEPGSSVDQKIQAAYEAVRGPSGPRRSVLDRMRSSEIEMSAHGFRDVVSQMFYSQRKMTASDYIGVMRTYSDHIASTPDERVQLEENVLNAIESEGGMITVYDSQALVMGHK